MRIYECEIKLKKARQRETQSVSDFVQYLNRIYLNLNYTVFDEKKLRTLRRKIFEFIILKFFKHVNVKIIIIYFVLTSFYIVIENILRNIDFMKKLETQIENANNNIENENAESQFNYNNNQKKSKSDSKQKVFVDKNSQTSAQSNTNNKFKKKQAV